MKPVNQYELNKGYFNFIIHFVVLVLLAVLCTAGFFLASKQELKLLSAQAGRYDRQAYQREELTARFDQVLFRLRALSRYVNADARELSNQALLINGVQAENNRVRGLLEAGRNEPAPGYELYGKMTRQVVALASLKDSLSQTRFSTESLRQQLDACGQNNKQAIKRLNRY
jgi:hypothetical protein